MTSSQRTCHTYEIFIRAIMCEDDFYQVPSNFNDIYLFLGHFQEVLTNKYLCHRFDGRTKPHLSKPSSMISIGLWSNDGIVGHLEHHHRVFYTDNVHIRIKIYKLNNNKIEFIYYYGSI